MFQIRTTCPKDNKYYIRQASGGWSKNIKGKPTQKGADVLANCVGYANGRYAEIIGKKKIEYQFITNAENFIEVAKKYGLKISNVPTLGGIMVWQKGATLDGKDGAGHVAIVEKIINNNTIYTSESGYGSKAFWNATRNNNNGRWGAGATYKFRGCIVNPSVENEPNFTKGTYQLLKSKYARTSPMVSSDNKIKYNVLRQDVKELCEKDDKGYAKFKKGAKLELIDFTTDKNGNIWGRRKGVNTDLFVCVYDETGYQAKKI